MTAQICVQISVVSGEVPLNCHFFFSSFKLFISLNAICSLVYEMALLVSKQKLHSTTSALSTTKLTSRVKGFSGLQ